MHWLPVWWAPALLTIRTDGSLDQHEKQHRATTMSRDTVNVEIGPDWTPLTTDATRVLVECALGACKFRNATAAPASTEVFGHSLKLGETTILDSPTFARADPDTGQCIVVISETAE